MSPSLLSRVGWDRALDPQLYDFYHKKLLEPGWAGLLTLSEAEYIRQCLERDSRLRRRWHIRHRKVVPLSLIVEKAFPENPPAARKHMKAEQAKSRRRIASKHRMSPVANTVSKRDERFCPIPYWAG